MSYTKKEMDGLTKKFKESLKPLWNEFSYAESDRGKKLPKPDTVKKYKNKEVIELDRDIQNVAMKSLHEAINSRRSVRKYQDKPLTFKEFSYICLNTCAIRDFGPGYAFGVIPTGGATNSMETYIYVNKVTSLKSGLYHFMKDTNNIELINPEMKPETFSEGLKGQLRDAAIAFVFTTIPYRAEYKYSYLSHKVIAAEAGHACQNVYLLAESIDCGAVAIAAYDQEKLDELLELGEEEFAVYAATRKKIII